MNSINDGLKILLDIISLMLKITPMLLIYKSGKDDQKMEFYNQYFLLKEKLDEIDCLYNGNVDIDDIMKWMNEENI